MKYLVNVNTKYIVFNKIDNAILTTNSPLGDLREMFPTFDIQRGNSGNWNISLFDIHSNRRLYYTVKPISSVAKPKSSVAKPKSSVAKPKSSMPKPRTRR